MHNNNNKLTIFFLLFAIVALVLFITRLTYISIEYKKDSQNFSDVHVLKNLDSLFNVLGKEQTLTAIYVAQQNEKNFDELQKVRDVSNVKIERLLGILSGKEEYTFLEVGLKKVLYQLEQVRLEVNNFTRDYQKILIEIYGGKIIDEVNGMIGTLTKRLPSAYQDDFKSYNEVMKIKQNLGSETAFVSYFIGASKKMNADDNVIWTNFIGYDISPMFKDLNNLVVMSKLHSSLKMKDYEKLRNEIRVSIYEDSMKKGKYRTSLDEWQGSTNIKFNKLVKAQEILLSNSNEVLTKNIEELESEIFMYVLLSTLSLFSILYLINSIHASKRHRVEVEATLKDIENDLTDKQRLEIQEVLKKNNTLEVYKFLARTIREPNLAKDHFLANMSHEIRTPLNGIIGFTTILQGSEMNEEQHEFLNIIRESSNNLLIIVNDILDFSKISSGNFEVENIPFNIVEKMEATVETYSEKASEKDIELGLFVDPILPLNVIGDPTRISQVLLNLFGNAVKFTKEKGEVNVSVKLLSSQSGFVTVRFSVQDTGIGIAKEKQEDIFDPFSQADASTNRKFGGTGLGLTISKKFVELMGGTLKLESEKGVGSTFYFDLDLEIDKENAIRKSPNYAELKVGYLKHQKNHEEIEDNLRIYVTFNGARYRHYYEDQLLNIDEDELPHILFVNHQHAQSEKLLNHLSTLPVKVILMTMSNKMNENEVYKELFHKIIYMPVNFSKVSKILELETNPPLNNVLLYKDSELSGKIYLSILESFGYEVDVYNTIYEFKRQLEKKKYRFALFDDKKTNNEMMAQVIKRNGAIPFLFSEEKKSYTYCNVLDYSIDANELKEQLDRA